MALTITLTAESEAELRRRAEVQNRGPEELATEAVEAMLAQKTPGKVLLGRIEEMRRRLPSTGPLSEKAFERATAYEE